MTPDRPEKADAEKPGRQPGVPAPGPHARPGLTDKDKTPGSGMLPDAGEPNSQAPSG
jgi:hypothetical protein